MVGSKMFLAALPQRLASHGMVVFVINYRLAPEAAHPAQIIDCKRALLWVKQNCERWNGDPNRVFVTGESAGGHLAALVGVTGNYGPFQPPENPHGDTSVAGCIPVCGIFDWEDGEGHQARLYSFFQNPDAAKAAGDGGMPLVARAVLQKPYNAKTKADFEQGSPLWHLKEALHRAPGSSWGEERILPPFMVIHGSLDELAPVEGAKEFFTLLLRVRQKYPPPSSTLPRDKQHDVLVECPGEHHAMQQYVPSPRLWATADAMADFCFFHARGR